MKIGLFLIVSLLISGCHKLPVPPVCSQIPVPSGSYHISTQQKMQAMYHWSILADDIARQIQEFLKKRQCENGRSTYVAPSGTTPFEKAFHELLITRLVEKGLVVSYRANSHLVLSFDVQMITHCRKIIRTGSGVYKSLAPGFYVRSDVRLVGSERQTGAVENLVKSAEVNVEAGLYTYLAPNTEIMITTSLAEKNNYIMRFSSIYYINDPDWWHYKHKTNLKEAAAVNYTIVDK